MCSIVNGSKKRSILVKTGIATMVGCFSLFAAAGIIRPITSMELTREMKVGWNLGNTLDAKNDNEESMGLESETCWGNVKTSKAMMDMLKAKGFNVVRVPVTWEKHMGSAPDYTVDKAWMDRVEEVVNYVLDNNMYCLLNSHHDEWVVLHNAEKNEAIPRLEKLWTQIATRFKDYGDYLVFETLNEPRLYGEPTEWSGGTAEARTILNEYNVAAVNAMRATGGNNATRHIMIPTHAATSMETAQNALTIPDGNIIVSQHTYWPYDFTMNPDGTDQWGSATDKSNADKELDRIAAKFVQKGIPVIIGEWGSINRNNNDAARVVHAGYYAEAARKRGMIPVWWDNGGLGTVINNGAFGLLDRKNLSWFKENIADALVKGAEVGMKVPVVQAAAKKSSFNGLKERSGHISYSLSRETTVSIAIFTMQGQRILNLVHAKQATGNHAVTIPAKSLSSGHYIVQFRAGDNLVTKRIALLNQ